MFRGRTKSRYGSASDFDINRAITLRTMGDQRETYLGCASSSAVGLMPIPKEHPTAFLPSASGGHDSRVLHREQSTPVHFSSSGHSHCEQLKRDSFRAL